VSDIGLLLAIAATIRFITSIHPLLLSVHKRQKIATMSTEMTVAPAREDCTRCSEVGGPCTLHQNLLQMQQEPGDMSQTPHTYNYESAGHGDQSLSEQSHMSKKAAKEMNRAKTQEGQMISVSSSSCLPSSLRHIVDSILTLYRL
jgi:hypothetical protein